MPKKEGNILIVDDNKSVLSSLQLFLKYKFSRVFTENSPNALHNALKQHLIDVVLLDMNFKAGVNTGNEGIYWLREIKKQQPDVVVIMITAYGDIELAVKALKEGASDFVLKPWDNQKLYATILAGLELRNSNKKVQFLKSQQKILQESESQIIWGKSPAMQEIRVLVNKVASTEANVLITGENGTGKEVLAKEIHRLSDRSDEVFVSVDLGSVAQSLFESELFGYAKGAFTDAKTDRIGRIEAAQNGTLFLDEVGNIPQSVQAKLLTVLQNKYIVRIGENASRNINIRLIAATNEHIRELIDSERFREDLYFRINTIEIELPPLRKRKEDMDELALFFLEKYAQKYKKHGLSISKVAMYELKNYGWPGNIRELQHTIERAVILADSGTINQFNLEQKSSTNAYVKLEEPHSLEEFEKEIIRQAIKRNGGNISYAAKELGVGRQTMYRKIEKYGL